MRKILVIAVAIVAALSSCKKYLDEKPDTKLAVPVTLQDLQALLDNYNYMNTRDACFGEVSADDYYVNDADHAAMVDGMRNMYLWNQGNFYTEANLDDWLNTYNSVFFANTVLEGVEKVTVTGNNVTQWKDVKGQGLFHRGKSFFDGVVVFAKGYDASASTQDPGIVLRLKTDITAKSTRARVADCYQQVINDLKEAALLLPVNVITTERASKPAAYGLLARVYLSMRLYDSCYKYSEMALGYNNVLMNFNTLSVGAAYPVPRFNSEVLYESQLNLQQPIETSRAKIDSNLYSSYGVNDLRKTIYFKSNGNGSYSFKGSYIPNGSLYSGVTTDEVYLMKAECLARQGKTNESLTVLNALLITRYKTGLFVAVTAANSNDALQKILAERRKELVMRGLRWMDVKRLNAEGAGIVLKRKINNVQYTLAPNSPRYAIPIPDDVIRITGMEQNSK